MENATQIELGEEEMELLAAIKKYVRGRKLSLGLIGGIIQQLQAGVLESTQNATPIESLGLPTRAFSALKMAGINTIGQLLDTPIRDLKMIRHFGATSLRTLRHKLTKIGLTLKENTPSDKVP